MKEIKLTQGYTALVDDEDYGYLNKFRWHASKDGRTIYALTNIPKQNGGYKKIKMHRLIMSTPIGMETDHKDHNGLNNQKYNLRVCTRSQNQSNRNNFYVHGTIVKRNGKSKYIGVSPFRNKYMSTIRVNNKKKYLGLFETEEEAAKVYDEIAKMHRGEFASLNFKKV